MTDVSSNVEIEDHNKPQHNETFVISSEKRNEVIRIPGMDAFVISNVLTLEESNELIHLANESGFKRSGEGGGPPFAGNRSRSTFFAKSLSDRLFERIQPHISPLIHQSPHYHDFLGPPVPFGTYKPVGVNDMMRVSYYKPGGEFRLHRDTGYLRDEDYVGFWTILVYLNDTFEGGQTIMYYDNEKLACTVQPQIGKVLAFYHYHLHAGLRIEAGNKLILRTEIMFGLVKNKASPSLHDDGLPVGKSCAQQLIRIPDMDALIISNVLTLDECNELIHLANESGFKRSGQDGGPRFAGNRSRSTFFAKSFSDILFERIQPHLSNWIHNSLNYHDFLGPSVRFGTYKPVGVNDMMRVSYYEPGGEFRLHRDTGYVRDEDYVGFWTILVYLNDIFEGGKMNMYYDNYQFACTVQPEIGKVLAFYHYHKHAGLMIESGNKIVLRTEIMYELVNNKPSTLFHCARQGVW